MKILTVLFILAFSSCSERDPNGYHEKAKTMVCNADQLKLVSDYMKNCEAYFREHCFDMALNTLCTDPSKQQEPQQ